MTETQKTQMAPETLISPSVRSAIEGHRDSRTILSEAEFGYRHIRDHLVDLPVGGRVLEVGSGPCVLLSQVKCEFPALDVTGIEPIGPGFDRFDDTLRELTEKFGFRLLKIGYEEFEDPKGFDLIFLVNVFEHLPDWRHFLGFVSRYLNPGGRCVILCPNYGFPYESHFKLPIIWNKDVTARLFKSVIDRREAEHGYPGLWASLNFVKWPDVRRAAPGHGLRVSFEPSILREMVGRLQYDEAFAQRQKSVALLARLALASGVVRLLELPTFQRFNPYMKLEIAPVQADGH